MRVNYLIILVLSVMITSCSKTEVIQDWVEEGHEKTYQRPMIIGISDSQQTRQIYEKQFVSELAKRNITATPSYRLINSKQKMNRDTVIDAVEGTDIDSVIITYLVSSETEVMYHESPLSQGYSGDPDSTKVSATLISTRGRTSSAEIITLKNDLYDVETKTLRWTAQTRTVAPESIDEVVTEVTSLLVEQLIDDGVLK
ncbi:MAG: hypothetical protein KJN89_01790 [Gammaproteobacteria bacterium]|nr:hypothetical protein [Gammaproteobacteria bacterium]NNJ49076.1 hypothetical protein [Gammaproteobacteria bacterium]